MERLTKKLGNGVLLPTMPVYIRSKEDLDKYTSARRELEENTVVLAEYEDLGTVEEIKSIIEQNKDLKRLSEGLLNNIKIQIDMFSNAEIIDGEHTLKVSHEVLVKLKNKLEELVANSELK